MMRYKPCLIGLNLHSMKDKTEYIVLNIRGDLTRKTRDKMKRMCLERKMTYGQLLEEAFGN